MTTTSYTEEAKQIVGNFVVKAGKTFLVIKCSDVFGDEQTIRLSPATVAEFFATQARNLSSGCRTLGGLTGDWRPVSELAQAALNWFKLVNVVGMRRAGRKVGLIPRF